MKKIKIVFAIVVLSFFSCSKDDETGAVIEPYKSAAFQAVSNTSEPIIDSTVPDVPGVTTSNIFVSTTGSIKDYKKVSLEMYVSHAYGRDLEFILVTPDNTEKTFVFRIGTGKAYDQTQKLEFNALYTSVLTESGDFIPQGKYKESKGVNYASAVLQPIFSFLQDKNINGIWKLKIKDHGVGDIGMLVSWKLQFAEDALN
jgi:subtilisin-like proprotein convertase family protein